MTIRRRNKADIKFGGKLEGQLTVPWSSLGEGVQDQIMKQLGQLEYHFVPFAVVVREIRLSPTGNLVVCVDRFLGETDK